MRLVQQRRGEKEREVSLVIRRLRRWLAFRPPAAEHGDVPSSTRSSFLLPLPPSASSFPAFTCHESGPHERGLFSARRVQQTPVTIVPLWREAYNYNMPSRRHHERTRSLTISTRWPILVECVRTRRLGYVRANSLVIEERSAWELNLCHGERDKSIGPMLLEKVLRNPFVSDRH